MECIPFFPKQIFKMAAIAAVLSYFQLIGLVANTDIVVSVDGLKYDHGKQMLTVHTTFIKESPTQNINFPLIMNIVVPSHLIVPNVSQRM